MSNETKQFRVVIEGIVRGGIMYRGKKFRHPTMGVIQLGENSSDEFYKEHANAWPFSQGPIPSPDPKKNRATHQDIADMDAETVMRVYTATNKTLDEIRVERELYVDGKVDAVIEPLTTSYSAIQQKALPLFSEALNARGRNPNEVPPMLQIIADITGETVDEVQTRLKPLSDGIGGGVATAFGLKHKLLKEIKAAYDHSTNTDMQKIDAILAVVWP